ncbi:MAG: hypothetical protein IV107_20780 [Paucibacter sp.]|nr:hypothetical protein [Roseateles sp.]
MPIENAAAAAINPRSENLADPTSERAPRHFYTNPFAEPGDYNGLGQDILKPVEQSAWYFLLLQSCQTIGHSLPVT